MAFDTAFLDSLPPLVEWLGASFRRNTFFIKTEDTLDTINATNILENGESVESTSQNAPLPPESSVHRSFKMGVHQSFFQKNPCGASMYKS